LGHASIRGGNFSKALAQERLPSQLGTFRHVKPNNPTRKLSEGEEPTTANNPTRKLSEGEEITTEMTMEIAEGTRLHRPLSAM